MNEPGVPTQLDARFYADPTPENAVTLTIEIEPAADFRLPPPHCENRVSAPVDVWLRTADGVLDTRFSALLLGEPSQVRIEIDEDERATVTGTIELGESERVELMPLGDPARELVAPWPCGHEQLPLNDARWNIPPSQILAALNGRTDDVHFDPAGDVRVRLDLTPIRMTACREDPSPVTGDVPVQLTLTDVDHGQPLISWVGQFVFGLTCENEPYDPTSAPACSEFELVARGAPAIGAWRFWPEPPIEPRRLKEGNVALRGTLRVDGSLSARVSLGFFYNGGTPKGAYTGAAWSFDEP